MANRQQVHAFMEILAGDINNVHKGIEKVLLETFLGNALPKLPAFVGNGFRPEIAGNTVTIAPGIAFQQLTEDPVDGSSRVRIAHLINQSVMNFNLPNGNNKKVDLIECRSIVQDDPAQSRRFDVAGAVVERDVVTSTRWSSEVQVKENVAPDANGNYQPSIGWTAIAVVHLAASGIERIEDIRSFYNVFDPDFFSTYARTNIGFSKVFDGIRLIEIPFTFSDLVPKIDQVNVRRRYKGIYGEITVTNNYGSNFTMSGPVGSVTALTNNGQTFNGDISNIHALNSDNTSVIFGRFYTSLRDRLDGRAIPNDLSSNHFYLRLHNVQWVRGSYGEQDIWGVRIGISGALKNNIISGGGLRKKSINNGLEVDNLTGVVDDLSQAQFNAIPNSGVYIILSTSITPNLSNSIVWNIPKANLVLDRKDLCIDRNTLTGNGIAPIYRASDMTVAHKWFRITTVNPITTVAGERRYLGSGLPINIAGFYQMTAVSYDPVLKRLSFTLNNTGAGATEFPGAGIVFDRFRVRKGSETRLLKDITDVSIALSRTTATYTYDLTELDTLIKPTDRAFNDFRIEFDVYNQRGEQIWRTLLLRRDVDFELVEEGSRTHVRLKDDYPFEDDDELIFSHVVPQSLINQQSGTPESVTLERQVKNLEDMLNMLKSQVDTNKGDISKLQNESGADVSTTLLWNLTAVGNRTRSKATIEARVDASIAAGVYNEEVSPNIDTAGALIDVTAPAPAGSYFMWIAVETSRVDNIVFDDDEISWYRYKTMDISGTNYTIFVRQTSLRNGQEKQFLIKNYE